MSAVHSQQPEELVHRLQVRPAADSLRAHQLQQLQGLLDVACSIHDIIGPYDHDVQLQQQVQALRERCLDLETELQGLPTTGTAPAFTQSPLGQEASSTTAEESLLLAEVERMRAHLSRRESAGGFDARREREQRLVEENSDLRLELEAVRRQNNSLAGRLQDLEARNAELECEMESTDMGQLRKQIKEFTLNTQMELEKKLTACATRAVSAEEQLDELQKYMDRSTVAYQKEIVRLRDLVAQHAPGALKQMGSREFSVSSK